MRYMMFIIALLFTNQILAKDYSVRLMILKHSYEKMCNEDANLAIAAVKESQRSGLNSKVIENKFTLNLSDFKKTIEEKIKVDSKKGDTLIIFTIGHGMENGNLHNLGSRSNVMHTIGNASEKYNQKILWWQLSCYAQAYLPNTSSLNEKQQNLFSIVSSSSAYEPSPPNKEGRHIRQLLMSLAKKDTFLDKDKSEKISTEELKTFLDLTDFNLGKRLYAKPKNTIFEVDKIILKIVDRNNIQKKYEEDYVFSPSK